MLMPALFSVIECAGEAQRLKGELKENKKCAQAKAKGKIEVVQ